MGSKNRAFLLGARDPEMDLIEEIVERSGSKYSYATKDGQRVNPGNAYQADDEGDDNTILVECGGRKLNGRRIDHHNPGDPGFGKEPKEFLTASSLGQVINLIFQGVDNPLEAQNLGQQLLGVESHLEDIGVVYQGIKFDDQWIIDLGQVVFIVPSRFVLQAAADNCLNAAYAGQCPGVNREALEKLQIKNIATATGTFREVVDNTVREFGRIFEAADITINFGGNGRVFDLTRLNLGRGYSLRYLALKEAAARGSHTYLIRHQTSCRDSPFIMLNGNPTPGMVDHFLTTFAREKGLVRTIGNLQRGYAVGCLPE